MATVYNLAIDQGSDFTTTIQVNDDAGADRNLAGYSVRGQLRRSYGSTSNVAFSSNVSGISTGEITISLSSAATANLKYGRYVYDIELYTNTGNVERILEGIVTVYPEVTK